MGFDISKNNIKALKFRDELIELLNKYQCTLSAYEGDDNMVLDFYDSKLQEHKSYIMTDEYDNYNLYVEDGGHTCIMDMLINSIFNTYYSRTYSTNTIHTIYGIITDKPAKAEAKLMEIYNKYHTLNQIKSCNFAKHDKYIQLNDGQLYRWIDPTNILSNRGYRCQKVIIDRNITSKELYNVILPMCYTNDLKDIEIF